MVSSQFLPSLWQHLSQQPLNVSRGSSSVADPGLLCGFQRSAPHGGFLSPFLMLFSFLSLKHHWVHSSLLLYPQSAPRCSHLSRGFECHGYTDNSPKYTYNPFKWHGSVLLLTSRVGCQVGILTSYMHKTEFWIMHSCLFQAQLPHLNHVHS